jgi:hypothetical protein
MAEYDILETGVVIFLFVSFSAILYSINRPIDSVLPFLEKDSAYSFDTTRISEEEVELTVTGGGTGSKVQLVVDGEVRGSIRLEDGATEVVKMREGEELSVRDTGIL